MRLLGFMWLHGCVRVCSSMRVCRSMRVRGCGGAVAMRRRVTAIVGSEMVVRQPAPVPVVMNIASPSAHPLEGAVVLTVGLRMLMMEARITSPGSVPVVMPSLIVHRALLDPGPIGRSH
ncbi:hypothetical protein [Microvirga calopogonii]|uniref:hypothetical protein n=1 Tax=Microvirga calopogonii TaxID=2078013 RepID=UPI0013B41F65|nr:hypothetical protein [Microvirga calopogonii]